jgi:hypothetical protein
MKAQINKTYAVIIALIIIILFTLLIIGLRTGGEDLMSTLENVLKGL